MANRNSGLATQKPLAASAASFVLLAISVPALAASSNKLLCDAESDANLNVPVEKLTTQVVDLEVTLSAIEGIPVDTTDRKLAASRLLAPQAEAAIRDAFLDSSLEEEHPAPDLGTSVLSRRIADEDTAAETGDQDASQTVPVSGMNTRLPGVSDNDLSRFKKQMFRRDI